MRVEPFTFEHHTRTTKTTEIHVTDVRPNWNTDRARSHPSIVPSPLGEATSLLSKRTQKAGQFSGATSAQKIEPPDLR